MTHRYLVLCRLTCEFKLFFFFSRKRTAYEFGLGRELGVLLFESPGLPPAESSGTNARRAIDKARAVTVAVDEGRDILVPDFLGKTMREEIGRASCRERV